MRTALGTLIVALAVGGQLDSVVNSSDGLVPIGVRLELPPAYVTTSPISRTLDLLSLLSIPQTVWLLCVAAALVLAFVAAGTPRERLRGRLLRTLLFVVATMAVMEALVILLPRPMARLTVSDADVVRVDFHSHTKASHDAYQRFTSERNREWHQSGGFDIAFITDHVKWWGAMEARPLNPLRAGDRVSLLTAVEGHYKKVSTVMLGLTRQDTAILTGWGELEHGKPSIGRQPVTIIALPGKIASVAAAAADTFPEFTGLELIDAAPRGLGQLDNQEDSIRAIAGRRTLILVASSNNHGWGRTVVAWNLVKIPGWRSLSPDSVGRLIETPFRTRDTSAVKIIKRLRPRTHGLTLPLTLPVAVYQTFGSLTVTERGVWIVWIWITTMVVVLRRRSLSA